MHPSFPLPPKVLHGNLRSNTLGKAQAWNQLCCKGRRETEGALKHTPTLTPHPNTTTTTTPPLTLITNTHSELFGKPEINFHQGKPLNLKVTLWKQPSISISKIIKFKQNGEPDSFHLSFADINIKYNMQKLSESTLWKFSK